jgi:hypothetical protein
MPLRPNKPLTRSPLGNNRYSADYEGMKGVGQCQVRRLEDHNFSDDIRVNEGS